MKLVSWNVNGIRAAISKGFDYFFKNSQADIFCIQETKIQEEQLDIFINSIFNGYEMYWNSALKKGYSGTAIFTKEKPQQVLYGIGEKIFDEEGRAITLEYESFYLVNVYVPNAKRTLERLDERMVWEDKFRQYVIELDQKKPVIICGDMNVAYEEIDLTNSKQNIGNAGFTYEEREKMQKLFDSGFTDTFRYLYPNKENAYSWWSYMHQAREKNIGWRLDYFIVSKRIVEKIKEAIIYSDILGSDHCPVGLEITEQ